MSTISTDSSLPYLNDIIAQLTPELIVARAAEIERVRDSVPDWTAFFGHGDSAAWTTPFEWLVGLLAHRAGAFAFDRLDRTFLQTPAAWVDPAFGPAYYRVGRGSESILAPSLWPFAMEQPVSDYTSSLQDKWWSHGLIHTLVGGGVWPGLTEWDIMAQSRLSEALAAVHWYNLAELGRLGDGDFPMDLTDLRGDDAGRYLKAARRALDSESRARAIGSDTSLGIAHNAVEILGYELFAYRRAVQLGDLLEPEGTYLGIGESCEYARVHRRRLTCPSHARWRAHCLVPGVDFAEDVASFEQRVALVAADLFLTPLDELIGVTAAAADARRARRVLQDIGYRLCQAELLDPLEAATSSKAGRHEAALQLIRTALEAPAFEASEVFEAVSAAIVEACAGSAAPASDILALGYDILPGHRGPEPVRAARRSARLRRAFAYHPAIGSALAQLPEVLDLTLDLPTSRTWVERLIPASEHLAQAGTMTWEAWAYIGWLTVPVAMWRDDHATTPAQRWHYRVAQPVMPADPATWGEFEIIWNPYLQRVPMPFDARWEEAQQLAPRLEPVIGQRFKPRSAHAIWYCLIGTGRRGPVYIPLTTRLNALIQRLKRSARLDVIARDLDFGPEFVASALASDAVLLVHRPVFDLPERPLDALEVAMAAAASVEQRREDEGPWQDPEQADAYAAFCAKWPLYKDTSEALCDAAEIARGARVAELGFGTGETTRAILRRIGEDGRVIAADPALRVVTSIFDYVNDSRVRFLPGAARSLLQVAVSDRLFDRVIANSSLVLAKDMGDELAHCFAMLAPGGRIAFSMQAEYLGDVAHMTTPAMLEAVTALEAVRAEQGLGAPVAAKATANSILGSFDTLAAALNRIGFTGTKRVIFRRPMSAAEYFDWLAMPVVRQGMVAPADAGRSLAFIEAARARISPTLELETAWALVLADRPEDEGPEV